MKRDPDAILNSELSHVIASLGHGDVLVVSDVGYPIPEETRRVDLALTRGVPTLEETLSAVNQELIAERVMFADDVPDMNPDYDAFLRETYEGSGIDVETIPHAEVIDYGAEAKAVVRTGDFEPWGNVVIECGTDPKAFFSGENVEMPADYERRYREMYGDSP